MRVLAFSPTHITGIVEIHDRNPDPLLQGSRGAGFSLQKGVRTEVQIKHSIAVRSNIFINNVERKDALVSKRVITLYEEITPKPFSAEAKHYLEMPVGSGFGTSGAGALGLSLGLNEALGTGLSLDGAAQIAHRAEVECRTGLGSVIAETNGGFEIRVKPGAPGIGVIRKIPIPGEYSLVSLNYGALSTPKALGNEKLRTRINRIGGDIINSLLGSPSIASFLKLSKKFTESIGLIRGKIVKPIQDAEERGFTCSSALFGENVFSIVKKGEVKDLTRVFRTNLGTGTIIVSDLDEEGARLI